MASEGADLIDVGGESTRPGSQRVGEAEQLARVAPVVRALASALRERGWRVPVSVDTTRAAVAEAALEAGAEMINDVSAGREDEGMLALAASWGVPICLMHMQGEPGTMQKDPRYGDVVGEVREHLLERCRRAEEAGVNEGQVLIDPGIGFGKTAEHNLALLRALGGLVGTGRAVLLGTSRKGFMGALCRRPDGSTPAPVERVGATCATTAWGVACGVRVFRVHDVMANRQAADVAFAMLAADSKA
jgi:dihydropteroate synthase